MAVTEQYQKDSLTQRPYQHYLKRYQSASPSVISENVQLPYYEEEKAFFVRFMGISYKVTWPEFEISHETEGNGIYMLEESIQAKILLLRYLLDADAASYSGKLLSYHDLPWGEVYYRQFHGRCILRLAKTYGRKTEEFQKLMESLHGMKRELGDISYEFEFLEGLHLCFILWEGDEEFAPSAQILFSDNFPAAFSAEDVAYVIDVVMDYMKKAEKQSETEKKM